MEQMPTEAIIDGFDVQMFETQQDHLCSDDFNTVARTIRPIKDEVRDPIHQQASAKRES
jgi:hypothetical protein